MRGSQPFNRLSGRHDRYRFLCFSCVDERVQYCRPYWQLHSRAVSGVGLWIPRVGFDSRLCLDSHLCPFAWFFRTAHAVKYAHGQWTQSLMWMSVHPGKGRTLRGDVSAGKGPKNESLRGSTQCSQFAAHVAIIQQNTIFDRPHPINIVTRITDHRVFQPANILR